MIWGDRGQEGRLWSKSPKFLRHASMFRIQILEQRLLNHEETALSKYRDLDVLLQQDPRISAMN